MRTRADQYKEFNVMVAKLLIYCIEHNIPIKGGEWWRTPEQAEVYVKRGTGIRNSKHIYSLAIDLKVTTPDGFGVVDKGLSYAEMGIYWKSLGGIWGQDIRKGDYYHFEFNERPVLPQKRGKNV